MDHDVYHKQLLYILYVSSINTLISIVLLCFILILQKGNRNKGTKSAILLVVAAVALKVWFHLTFLLYKLYDLHLLTEVQRNAEFQALIN